MKNGQIAQILRFGRSKPNGHPTTQPAPAGCFAQLAPALQQAIAAKGYTTPSLIQEQSIPPILEGRDLLGCAQTGTGKTAAFALPLLQRLSEQQAPIRRGCPRALILAPTRELAAQIGESLRDYGAHLGLRHAVIFGGVNQDNQVRKLNKGYEILVATPGRLLDLMQQGFIRLDGVEVFVLDEADRMLDMGFIPDVKRIVATLPSRRQTLFFTATLPPKVVELARNMVSNPVQIFIEPEKITVDRVAQKVLFVRKSDKDSLLVSILRDPGLKKVLIFTRMKHAANKVVDRLESEGIYGTAIHGNKSQAARTRALSDFKNSRYRVLVATDVAARGLDVQDITHVINYDLPMEAETYVHRIGRTARAGADGDAISFCTVEDRACLSEIEQLLGIEVPAQLDHEYHDEDAVHSRLPKPRNGGGLQRGGNGFNRISGGRSSRSGRDSGGRGYPSGRQPSRSPRGTGSNRGRSGNSGRSGRRARSYA